MGCNQCQFLIRKLTSGKAMWFKCKTEKTGAWIVWVFSATSQHQCFPKININPMYLFSSHSSRKSFAFFVSNTVHLTELGTTFWRMHAGPRIKFLSVQWPTICSVFVVKINNMMPKCWKRNRVSGQTAHRNIYLCIQLNQSLAVIFNIVCKLAFYRRNVNPGKVC